MPSKNSPSPSRLYAGSMGPADQPQDVVTKLRRWLKTNLFSSPLNSLVSVLLLAGIAYCIGPMLRWAVFDAAFSGDSSEPCRVAAGACWVMVKVRWQQFMFGFYPDSELWRIYTLHAICLLVPLLIWASKSRRLLITGITLVLLPIIAIVLLYGGIFGLPIVETHYWGGLNLTIIIAFGGIIAAFPLGICLALGRRSNMPIIKSLCICFIELMRGVPLISVLFMSSVMFPLFVPDYITVDKLLRAMIGIILFQAAYLAEVVRGGLAAIPKGQYEAAKTLGLSFWQSQRYIILPQALKIVIPGIVNSQIALFKDTTLVLIIGLFDFLGIVQAATTDPEWLAYNLEGYIFCALVYWLFCFAMSQYSQRLERQLHRG